ncbi:hypothetical protein, partial [Salmonella sp. gx-f7]|uniref:hypothetical protein n=1 Tax=Salmonella sp. gx-f7 TaxID=2582606 RepID=UPI001F409D06
QIFPTGDSATAGRETPVGGGLPVFLKRVTEPDGMASNTTANSRGVTEYICYMLIETLYKRKVAPLR